MMLRNILQLRQWNVLRTHCYRRYSTSEGSQQPELTDGEKRILDTLKVKFPNASVIQVADISGGCGAMYQISVESAEFEGKRTVQQHRMINEALREEIKEMHGLQINTKVPDK